MATKQVKMFASHHGVDADDVFAGTRIGVDQIGRLQNELSHYSRGWDQYMGMTREYQDEKQVVAVAHKQYDRMVSWSAQMGAISRQEYVRGFVDAWTSLQPV